jgi:hypothetical protein
VERPFCTVIQGTDCSLWTAADSFQFNETYSYHSIQHSIPGQWLESAPVPGLMLTSNVKRWSQEALLNPAGTSTVVR